MKIRYELDANDIRRIIAKEFGTNMGNVDLKAKEEWRGQGPMEHTVLVVSATIECVEEVEE